MMVKPRELEIWVEQRLLPPLAEEEIQRMLKEGYIDSREEVEPNEFHWSTFICLKWTPRDGGNTFGSYVMGGPDLPFDEVREAIEVLMERFGEELK